MASKEKLYERLAELRLIESAARQDIATLRNVWTKEVEIYQELLQLNCNQLPSDARSVEERLLEKRDLLRKLK